MVNCTDSKHRRHKAWWLADSLLLNADLVGTLRFVGIRLSNPGFDGPLGQQFYVNQIGIATWGVVLCTVTTLLYALRGSAPIGDPEAAVHMLIRARGWSSRRAWISIRARLLPVLVPLIALCVALFLDSALGWVVFHMRRRSGTRRRLDGWNASHPYRSQMRLPAPEPKIASRQ